MRPNDIVEFNGYSLCGYIGERARVLGVGVDDRLTVQITTTGPHEGIIVNRVDRSWLTLTLSAAPKAPTPLTIGDNVAIDHRDWPDRKGTVTGFNPATNKYQITLHALRPGDIDAGGTIWLGRGALIALTAPVGAAPLTGPNRWLRIEIPLDPDDIPDLADPQWFIEVLAERHADAKATIWKDPR